MRFEKVRWASAEIKFFIISCEFHKIIEKRIGKPDKLMIEKKG